MQLDLRTRKTILGIVVGVVAGGAADLILESPSRAVDFIGGAVLAVSLYILRREVRSFYGVIEIVFGLYVLWYASATARGPFKPNFSDVFEHLQLSIVIIQTFGAIYIIIRGLDNCLQGIKVPAFLQRLLT